MRRLFRILRRLLAIVVSVFLLLCAGLILFTRTGYFNRLVQARLNPYLAATFEGSLTIGSIRGSLWGDLELHNVLLVYQKTEVLRVPRVVVHYSLLPLLWRRLDLRVAVYDPVADLIRDSNGRWNLLEAIRSRHPSAASTSPSALAIKIDPITLNDGVAQLSPDPQVFYRLLRLQAAVSLNMPASGMTVEVSRLTTTIATPGKPSADLETALSFVNVGNQRRLELSKLSLTTARSELAANGKVELGSPPTIDAHLTLTKLAAADIAAFVSGSPLRADFSGHADFNGPTSALHSTAALSAAGATLKLAAQTDLTATPVAYSAELKLDGAQLKKLIKITQADALVSAEVTAQGKGSAIETIRAQGELAGRNLVVAGRPLGMAQLSANVSGPDLRATATLTGPAGAVNLQGSGRWSANPSYNLALAARNVDFAKAGPPGTIATRLNFSTTVNGHGLTPSTVDAQVRFNLTRSQVAGATINRGAFESRIAKGRAAIARANFALAGATLEMHGVGGFMPGAESNLEYAIQAPSVAELFKLARISGDGSVNAHGVVRGRYEHLRTIGEMSVTDLRASGYRAQTGHLRYDLAAGKGPIPTGSASLAISAIDLGAKLQQLTIAADLPAASPGMIAIRLDAEDNQGRRDRLVTTVNYRSDRISGRIETVALGMPDGTWELAAPVAFTSRPGELSLSDCDLRNGKRELKFGGTLGNRGPQSFQLALTSIDAGVITPFLPSTNQYAGILNGSLRVAGTAAKPTLALQLEADQVAVDSHPVGTITSQMALDGGQARLDAGLQTNGTRIITIAGSLSTTLSWTRGVKLQTGNDLDLRLRSDRFDLARIGALLPQTIRNLQGVAAFDLRAQGAPRHPVFNGNLRVAGVKGEIVPLGVTLTEMHARIDADSQQLRVTTFSAQAGDGSINASGAIALNAYAPQAVQINLKFDRWPAIATQEYHAVIGGNLAVGGTATAPAVTGQLEVLHATLRPPLEFLAATSQLTPDPTIKVIAPGEEATAAAARQGPPPSRHAAPSLFSSMQLGITVQIHRDTWIRHDQANVELEGRLRINKAAQGPLRIVGAINTVRGWVIYQQRRFDIASGTISFTGGESIDPTLDFDARYTLPNYTVDILVSGTASKPKLKLSSSPELAQADILSLILFGKTTSALGQGEQQSLQQRAMQMAGGYAAGQVGEAVMQSLGLQSLGFQMSGVSASGGSVGFGRYLNENTYVSATEDVGGVQGRQVSIQYFLLRWLSITTSASSNGGSGISLSLRQQY